MLERIKSIFSKEALELSIDNVPSAVFNFSGKNDRLEAQRSAILLESNELLERLKALSLKNSSDNYANVLKSRFCEKGIKSLSSLPSDYDALIERLSSSLNEISGIGFKEFRHFQVFKDDMTKVAAQIKIISEKLEEFKRFYYSSSEKKANDAIKLSSEIKSIESRIMSLDNEIMEIEKAVPFIREGLESNERKLSEIVKKLETIEIEKKGLISEMERERSIIKQKISTEFGKLDNIFKKAIHKEPEKYMTLSKYAVNAGDAFIDDENLEIRTFLEDLKPLFRKEDPEKCEKVLDILRNIDFFDSLRQQYNGLGEKIRETKEASFQESAPLEKERNHIIIEIEEKKKEISSLLEKRSQKSEEKRALEKKKDEKKSELQEKLQELFQKEIKIS